MRIAFRADASKAMGIGHLMRCLTVAEAARERGSQVRFVTRELSPSLQRLVLDAGHELTELPAAKPMVANTSLAHAGWLGASQATDAKATLEVFDGPSYDWVIVDHYALDHEWESVVRDTVPRCFVIDDLADRVHDCQVLLDQNIIRGMDSRYVGKVPAACRLLLGPTYALLRREFLEAGERFRARSGEIRRLLVFFGGGDADDFTSRALDGVVSARLNVEVDVVIGPEHPNHAGIATICARHGMHLHVSTTRMAALMSRADFAIGASGSASWERCFLGLPALCFATAQNQMAIGQGLAGAGAVVLGGSDSVSETVVNVLSELAGNRTTLLEMSARARQLVDGGGAERVCDVLYEAA